MTTTPETPAETIGRAAAHLRALATAASTNRYGNDTSRWTAQVGTVVDDSDRPFTTASLTADRANLLHAPRAFMYRQHAEYAATMDPTVGHALAAWLESWTGVRLDTESRLLEDAVHALTVARLILGEDR